MGAVTRVLVRVLVVEFYKQNAAFFGLILLVFFGFIRGEEHLAIGDFLISYPSALLFIYGIWLSYLIKIVLFTGPAIIKEENQFLSNFMLLPVPVRMYSLAATAFLLLLPALVYGAFLMYLAISRETWWPILSLLLAGTLFTTSLVFILSRKLLSLPRERSILQFGFATKYTRWPALFFSEHILRNEPVLFFLTKAYSCLLIIGTALLYETDTYDLRLMTTGVLLAFSGNVALINKYTWFYFHRMTIARNLPKTLASILLFHIAALSALLVPEYIFLVNYYPIPMNVTDIAGLIAFGTGNGLLIFALTLMKKADMEKLMSSMFWLIVSTTFLILYAVHPLFLGLLAFGLGTIITTRWHWLFEFGE